VDRAVPCAMPNDLARPLGGDFNSDSRALPPTPNIERRHFEQTFNAQRSTLNVQRSTFNAQRSTLNVQRPTSNTEAAYIEHPCRHSEPARQRTASEAFGVEESGVRALRTVVAAVPAATHPKPTFVPPAFNAQRSTFNVQRPTLNGYIKPQHQTSNIKHPSAVPPDSAASPVGEAVSFPVRKLGILLRQSG
jgi:hypothetical protein